MGKGNKGNRYYTFFVLLFFASLNKRYIVWINNPADDKSAGL
ncbi:hypothetical protein [uncultured Dysgonomonas sp.]|nr:hypothetical protein [uncultured Dysgonomonas sp.]